MRYSSGAFSLRRKASRLKTWTNCFETVLFSFRAASGSRARILTRMRGRLRSERGRLGYWLRTKRQSTWRRLEDSMFAQSQLYGCVRTMYRYKGFGPLPRWLFIYGNRCQDGTSSHPALQNPRPSNSYHAILISHFSRTSSSPSVQSLPRATIH